MNFLIKRRPHGLAVILTLVFLAGCGGGFDATTALQDVNATNPQRLANLYVQHQREHRGHGPKNETAFKDYIKQVNPVLLKRIGVDADQVDALFISDRDGEAVRIRYGLIGHAQSDPEPVVFETVGVDGLRMVAFTGLKTEEISDESEYQKMLGQK